MNAVHSETEYYRSVLDNLTGGFLSVDLEGSVVYVNPTAGRILHVSDIGVFVGRSYASALADFPTLCGIIRDALATHQTVHRAEVSLMHGDAAMIIGYSTLQVKNRAGEYLGLGIIFQDLTLVARKKS